MLVLGDKQGFKHIYIIGHSFGTGMVIRVVAEAGDRVRGLVLLGAVSPDPVPRAALRIFSLPECVSIPWAMIQFLLIMIQHLLIITGILFQPCFISIQESYSKFAKYPRVCKHPVGHETGVYVIVA